MAERGKQPVLNLTERQRRLEKGIAHVEDAYAAIGTPKYAAYSSRADLDLTQLSDSDKIAGIEKIGKLKEALAQKTIPALQALKAEVEVRSLEERVGEIERLARLGHLREEDVLEAKAILGRARESYASVQSKGAGKPFTEPSTLSRAKKSEEKQEDEQLQKIIIDRAKNEYASLASGWIATPGNQTDFKVLVLLANNAQEWVSAHTLSRAFRLKVRPSAVINRLRRYIEPDPSKPQILISAGKLKGARYKLNAQVEFVGESTHSKRNKEARVTSDVELFGQHVRVRGRLLIDLLESLKSAVSLKTSITTDRLAIAVYGQYNDKNMKLFTGLITQAKKLLKDHNIRVIQPVGPNARRRGNKAKYYLERVEVGQKASVEAGGKKPEEEKQKRKITREEWQQTPVFENTLNVLDLIVTQPEATADVSIKTFGLMRDGKPYHRGTARRAIMGGINKLFIRDIRGLLNDRERQTFERIAEFTGCEPQKVWRALRNWAIQRVMEGPVEFEKPELKEVLPKAELLTGYETIILARLMYSQGDLLKKLGIVQLPLESANKVIAHALKHIDGLQLAAGEDVTALKSILLKKLIGVVEAKDLENVCDTQPSEVQDLLIHFLIAGEQPSVKVLKSFADIGPEEFWTIKKGQPIRVWQEARLNGDLSPDNDGQEVDKVKPSAIEISDPKARQRIADIFTRIDEQNLPWPMSIPQVTRFFPRLKAAEFYKAEERRYVKPEKGRNNHPRYKKDEVALLLYIDEAGNSLSANQLKSLKRMIKEEGTKRISAKK